MSVPLSHQEVTVEHFPATQYDPSAMSNPNDTIIPVTEEQLVVEKRQVVVEYIRVRKTTVTTQQEVCETVRREYVEVREQRQDDAQDQTPLLQQV